MDTVNELLNMLFEFGLMLLQYLAPYKMEIVVGLVFATFFVGFLYSYK
jgi:hypothetical protein